jgi:SDR family mycofactocin-dependent oxidoreductase
VSGKVALVTGAARSQGRNHAIRLAEHGADIIAVDLPRSYSTVGYPMATRADLDETIRLVEATGRRAFTGEADVRELDRLTEAVNDGVAALGKLDVVVANAAINTLQAWDDTSAQLWVDTIDANLTGVWHTFQATVPHLISGGGGSVICISSTAGLKGLLFMAPYAASKSGVVGLARSMANELAEHKIRVNTVHPGGVDTIMTQHGTPLMNALIDKHPALGPIFGNSLPVEPVEPDDISNAVLFLASEESRYITGLALKVDAGNTNR